jgi:hypothetical protein
MSQLQFGGMVPFIDRSTGEDVEVRVWGAFVGQGVDAHEAEPIRQWIMTALTRSAGSYEGDVRELPAKAAEWGAYVSSQLAPELAQRFQAQGQIQIHGVQIGGAPAKEAPAPAMGTTSPLAKAFVEEMSMTSAQAEQAAGIAKRFLAHGQASAGGGAEHQAYGQPISVTKGGAAPGAVGGAKHQAYGKPISVTKGGAAPGAVGGAKHQAYGKPISVTKHGAASKGQGSPSPAVERGSGIGGRQRGGRGDEGGGDAK